MNDFESMGYEPAAIPVSFKVIGVGSETAGILCQVEALGYDCVKCIAAESPEDCIPTDDDKMVIIISRGDGKIANRIAKSYHDAGVLTLGMLDNADASCFDSVLKNVSCEDYPSIITSMLQPIVSHGYINFDFHDFSVALRDTGYFVVRTAESADVESAVNEMKKVTEDVDFRKAQYLSAHLCYNRERKPAVKVSDVAHLADMLSHLPENVNAMWSVNFDDTMPDNVIRLTMIMSGKGL